MSLEIIRGNILQATLSGPIKILTQKVTIRKDVSTPSRIALIILRLTYYLIPEKIEGVITDEDGQFREQWRVLEENEETEWLFTLSEMEEQSKRGLKFPADFNLFRSFLKAFRFKLISKDVKFFKGATLYILVNKNIVLLYRRNGKVTKNSS